MGTTGMDPELPPVPNVRDYKESELTPEARTQPTQQWLSGMVARKETMEIAIEALQRRCRSGLGAETLDAQRRLTIIREVYARHYGNDAKAFGKHLLKQWASHENRELTKIDFPPVSPMFRDYTAGYRTSFEETERDRAAEKVGQALSQSCSLPWPMCSKRFTWIGQGSPKDP